MIGSYLNGRRNTGEFSLANNPRASLWDNDPEQVQVPKFRVTIIYETTADGECAKRFADQFSADEMDDQEQAVTLAVWNFKVLGIPAIADIAARVAAASDLVIFSMCGNNGLSPHMEEWIEMWSRLIDREQPAVVVLFAAPVHENAPVYAGLRKAAMQKGLDYFLQTDRGMAGIRQSEPFSTRGQRAVEKRARGLR